MSILTEERNFQDIIRLLAYSRSVKDTKPDTIAIFYTFRLSINFCILIAILCFVNQRVVYANFSFIQHFNQPLRNYISLDYVLWSEK